MKIDGIYKNFNINFGQVQKAGDGPAQNETILPALKQDNTDISNIPVYPVNINTPIKYKKIEDFNLPGTDTKVQVYKLSNGQKVILVPKKGATQISTYVKCGSMNEVESQRGISHFIEHNLFNGSKNINPKEFFNRVNKMGAYTNAWTSEYGTSYLIQSQLFNSDDLSKIIELHADMIQYPQFDKSQIEKEKGVVNSEITMYDDSNYRIMSGKAYKQLFQIESDANDIIGGTVSNINNLTRDDIISYYNKNYTPDKMMTILTGEFNPDDAIELISKNFTKPLKTPEPQYNVELKPINNSKRIDYTSLNINTDEFVLGFSGPKNNNLKDTLSTEIALDILCGKSYSKLNKTLKKFQITPNINMSQTGNQPNSPNFIEIMGTSNPDDTEEVLKTIYSTIHNTKYEDLTEDVILAKKMMQKNIQHAFETGNSINSFLGNYLSLYSVDEIKNLPNTINSLTEEDIKSAMEKYLDLNKVSLVVSHPPVKKDNGPSFKGKLEKSGIDLHDFKYAKLQNNAEIYIQKNNSELKDFALNIKTPLPADINPKTHEVLTKLLNKGVNYQSEEDFSKDLSEHASSLYFYASPDGILIGGNALNDDINYTLNKAIDTINNPKFSQDELDEVKKVMRHEILEKNKSPLSCLESVMFPQLKTFSNQDEELKALNEVELGDVIGLMEYYRQNSSLNFCWNKDEVPYELNKLGQFNLTNNNEFRTFTPLKEDVLKIQSENSGQARIIQAFKFKQDKSPKEVAKLKILNSILGGQQSSRLFTDLRETQKLAYSTRSSIDDFGDTGLIILSIGTTTDNPQDPTATSKNITKSLNGFKKNIDLIKTQPVSEEELETAKLTIKSNILNMIETNSGKISKLIDDKVYFNDINYTNKLLKEIDNITAEDILETANRVFEGHSLTSIVASEKTLKELNLQH